MTDSILLILESTFPAGPRKRLFVDRRAYANGEPAVLLELDGGLRYRAERADWDGPTSLMPSPDRAKAPAMWVETRAKVVMK